MLLSGSGSLATLVFSSLAAAVPTELAPRVTANCTDFFIPVHATAPVKQIPLLNIPKNLDNVDVFVDFVTSEASSGLAALLALAGTHETTGDFMMSARYCEPTNKIASRANTIQYLQHAITMTKNYWNGLSYPEGFNGETYSYIDVASDVSHALYLMICANYVYRTATPRSRLITWGLETAPSLTLSRSSRCPSRSRSYIRSSVVCVAGVSLGLSLASSLTKSFMQATRTVL